MWANICLRRWDLVLTCHPFYPPRLIHSRGANLLTCYIVTYGKSPPPPGTSHLPLGPSKQARRVKCLPGTQIGGRKAVQCGQVAMYWQDNPAFLGQSMEVPCGGAWGAPGLATQKAELLELKASLKDEILRSRTEALPQRAPTGQLQAGLQDIEVGPGALFVYSGGRGGWDMGVGEGWRYLQYLALDLKR